MTLNGAIAQLVELENNSTMPEYFKPSIKEVINVLTSDVVERKKGEWKREVCTSGYGTIVMYQCSECKQLAFRQHNFCPNCGADMRGETDG